MKININFNGISVLYKTLSKKKEIEFEFTGQTLRDLITRLVGKFGTQMKDALLNSSGDIDVEIRVTLNDTTNLGEDRMETILNDGDTIAFALGG
ncbi:MAG: MoaD/ThiS family protein [Proteobacteria bacterium]|nr:MoaD/ThiS family protein [Pseudomonadota bacterium]